MSISAMKQAYAVPLLEQLESVPADARVMYEHSKHHHENIPAGRLCHEAAAALRQAIAQADKQEPVHAIDIPQKSVDETAKPEHDLWIAAACLKSTVESAIKAGDWKVDGACDPTRDLSYLADCLANPKREWVGLTKDEVDSWGLPEQPTVFEFAQFVEAKLKEKNA